MRTSKELKEIYDNINNGKIYGHYYKSNYPELLGETLFWNNLYITTSDYIYYNHFGSSATKNNISNLYWIITTIFDMSPKEFLQNYVIED